MNKKDLGQKNKKELVKLARDMRISGRSKLSKSELVVAVFLELNKNASSNEPTSKQLSESLDVQEEVEDSKYYTGSDNESVFYVEAAFTEKYDDNRVVLMVVSPGMIYAYWEINTKTLKKLGRRRKNALRLMLRVSYMSVSTQQEVSFDIPTEGADNWYINAPESGCSYWVEIGTKTAKGVFNSIMTSNTLDVPRGDFSEVLEETWTAKESLDGFEDEDFEEDVQETPPHAEEEFSQTIPDPMPSVAKHSDSQVHGELPVEAAESDVPAAGHEVYHVEPLAVEHDAVILPEEAPGIAQENQHADISQDIMDIEPSEQEPTIKIYVPEEEHEVKSVASASMQSLKQADFATKVRALSMGVRFDYEGGESAGVASLMGISSAELALMSSPELAGVGGSTDLGGWAPSNVAAGEAGKPVLHEEGAAGKRGRKFWYALDAELIVYGATESDAHVTLRGKPIKLRRDGTFTFRFPLPDGVIDIPVVFESNDRVDRGVIETKVTRETEYR